jgi:membrane protease YdiL (CAAX protease family)
MCSDYPTQLMLGVALRMAGLRPETSTGELSMAYVASLSLADSFALVALIVLFLRAHGEQPGHVLLGDRPFRAEVFVVLSTIQQLVPSLHTVAHNPLQDLLRTPRDTALFAVVVVVAGGVREAIQRAFLLHRFERWLGGRVVGVVAVSVAFGSGHLLQGADAAIATGLLGALWAVVYLRRRSAVAPMVAHSGFNLLQLAQFLVIGR